MGGKPVFTVPARTIVNFDSKFREKGLCDGPTFSAGTSCVSSCTYCYVPAMMLKQSPWLKAHGVEGRLEKVVIRREDAVKIARAQLRGHPGEARRTKKVIYGSPLVDVAGNLEMARETVEICKVILELTNWDIRLLSKSNLLPRVAERIRAEMGEFCGRGRMIYGVSTGTQSDEIGKVIEPGTALVSKRLASLHELQKAGYRTFGMICPSLPVLDYLGFARDMWGAIRGGHCENVWAECLNLRGASFTNTVGALRAAGMVAAAERLERVSRDKAAWEEYARETFLAHATCYGGGQLRFLQYVTNDTAAWWEEHRKHGAVPL
jgi:DNA repair photolyase